MAFEDRRHGGRALAARLSHYASDDGVVVLGLPRGGVPVAYEVARALSAPLDVLPVRKLGVPGHEELAFGAIAAGVLVLNQGLVRALGLRASEIDAIAERERRELARRERLYRGDAAPAPVRMKLAIVVDDGLATGATMRAAVAALRERDARSIVAAAPVGARETYAELADDADAVVCAELPEPFGAVGAWYRDFAPTGDDEVRALLASARAAAGTP